MNQGLGSQIPVFFYFPLFVLFQVHFEIRVFDRIIPEIKAFSFENEATNPGSEVLKAKFALFLAVFVSNQFFQVFKVDITVTK